MSTTPEFVDFSPLIFFTVPFCDVYFIERCSHLLHYNCTLINWKWHIKVLCDWWVAPNLFLLPKMDVTAQSAMFPRQTTLVDPKATPEQPALHINKQTVDGVFDENYWKQLCPKLHVNDTSYQQEALKTLLLPLDSKTQKNYHSRLTTEGYFQVGGEERNEKFLCMEKLAKHVPKLMQYGWPPSFLIMFDELWALVYQMSEIMQKTTGNQMNMDILIWYIDPNEDQSGFSPHRDRQPENPKITFREDGTPLYATCWIPFTDACPDNSCLYIIPKWADPGYTEGDDDEKDPLQVALSTKEAYQNIRSIPLQAGSAVLFTHRIIHWGSKGRKGYHTPRIACSFAGADDSYEPAYFSREHLPFPPMSLRLSLLAAQMLIYYQRFSFSAKELSFFYKLYRKNKEHFCNSYVQKVEFEFVNSIKENERPEQPDSDDDIMDDALNAVLEAKMNGYDGFDDDFDELSDVEFQDIGEEESEEEGEAFF